VLTTLTVTCVSVSEAPVFMYLLRPSQPVSSFLGNVSQRHDNSVIHISDMDNYMLHVRGSETLQTFTFRILKKKQRTSVTFQIDGNIPISLHVFASILYNKIFNSFTMLPSSSCTCVLLRKYWALSYVTWRIFHSDTFPQFLPSPFLLYDTHCYPISPLLLPGNAGYPC
jgi:hypothetical protein